MGGVVGSYWTKADPALRPDGLGNQYYQPEPAKDFRGAGYGPMYCRSDEWYVLILKFKKDLLPETEGALY